MSYEKKLTTFRKGNQLSNCGEYIIQLHYNTSKNYTILMRLTHNKKC